MQKLLLSFILAFCTLCTSAQKVEDKAEADQQVLMELLADRELQNWHPKQNIEEELLKETNERGIFRVAGEAFQVKSLRSDYFVKRVNGKWQPLFDSRYPIESMVNLLLARVPSANRQIELRHHQYGNHIALMTIPLSRLFDLWGHKMEIYSRVAIGSNRELQAWLVFYDRQAKHIHLLELKTPAKQLFESETPLRADFYSNIPQDNIKSLNIK